MTASVKIQLVAANFEHLWFANRLIYFESWTGVIGAGSMPAKNLKIGSLLLDQQNPRIPPVASQRDALQQVIDDQEDKLANLAESIVEEGLSPIDVWFVERSPTANDKFVVLEGNRRLAALKLLQNPGALTDLVMSSSLKKRFEAAAAKFKPDLVEPVSCFETTREEANPWIQRRHTGEDEGRGIVSWDGQAAARFRGGDPALQALEFVRKHGNLSDDQHAVLGGRFITTLRRLLESEKADTEILRELYWRALTRPPSEKEIQAATDLIHNSKSRRQAFEDIAWSLLNAKEFVLRY